MLRNPFLPEKIRSWLPFLLFAGVAFALFSNTFGHAWTMDDIPVIVQNPDVTSLSAFFRDSYPGRPLRELTFLIDHSLFGMNPAGYHIQNILWHGVNAFLLYLLALRLGMGRMAAGAAALLFLVHPIQVEVVAQVSHRKDSLALAFSLLSLLSYASAFDPRRRKGLRLCLAVSLAGVALLAKQNALVLPLVFAAWELAVLPPKERLLLRRPRLAWCLAGVAVAAGVAWVVSLGGPEAFLGTMRLSLMLHANFFGEAGFSTWYAMVVKSWGFMATKLLWPARLAVEYTFPVPRGWSDPWVVGALVGVFLYGVALLMAWRRRLAIPFFSLVWIVLFYLPVSNLLPTAYFAADRYLYAPAAGFCLLVAWGLGRLLGGRTVPVAAVAVVLAIPLAAKTWDQNRVWSDPFTLYSHALDVSPDAVYVLTNMGVGYFERGDVPRALEMLGRAVKVNPWFAPGYHTLGTIHEQLGNRRQALVNYVRAVEASPYFPPFAPTAEVIRAHLRDRYGMNLP